MSRSSSTQESKQQITDNRAVLGEGSIQASGAGSTVNVLDNGAVNRALDTADTTVDKAFTFGDNALTQVAAASKQALDQSADATALVKDAYADAKGRGALTDKILMGSVIGALIVAALAVKKG